MWAEEMLLSCDQGQLQIPQLPVRKRKEKKRRWTAGGGGGTLHLPIRCPLQLQMETLSHSTVDLFVVEELVYHKSYATWWWEVVRQENSFAMQT